MILRCSQAESAGWPFTEASGSFCDESSISSVHHRQSSSCCFSISIFIKWHILPASCVCLSRCGAPSPDMEVIGILIYLICRRILLWFSSIRVCLFKGFSKASHIFFFFSPLYISHFSAVTKLFDFLTLNKCFYQNFIILLENVKCFLKYFFLCQEHHSLAAVLLLSNAI